MSQFRNKSLERYAQRYILWYGQDYEFMRVGRNEFNEIDDTLVEKIQLRGIYHDGGRKLDLYRVLNLTTYGTYLSESMPQIFCLWEDCKKLKMHDILRMNDVTYIVTGVYNIHELNSMGEISLKIVQSSDFNIIVPEPDPEEPPDEFGGGIDVL